MGDQYQSTDQCQSTISLLVHLEIWNETRVALERESMHYFQHQEGLPTNVCIYWFLFIYVFIFVYIIRMYIMSVIINIFIS